MKGIVVEITNGKSVILLEDGTFTTRKDQGYTEGQQITLRKSPAGKLAALAAVLVLLCIGSMAWFRPVSYLYMDLNPSVRMEINSFRRVVQVVPLNEDAEQLLEGEKIGGSVRQCMEVLVDRCRAKGYLTPGADVEVHLCSDNDTLEETVVQTVVDLEQDEITVSVYEMSREDNREAVAYNMPAKRLSAIRSYTASFGGTLEENMEMLKGVTTPQILERIRQQEGIPTTDNKVSYASEQRLKAVKAYTDCFGGTREENFRLLRGLTTKEIWQKIHEKTGKTP